MVELSVAVRRRGDHDREEGGHQSHQQDAPGPGEGSRDERGDREEPDQADVPAVHGEDDRGGGHPEERDEGRDRLGAVGPLVALVELLLLVSQLGHGRLPRAFSPRAV